MHPEISLVTWILSDKESTQQALKVHSARLSCIQSSQVLSSLGSPKQFNGCTFISITVPFGPLCHCIFSLATNSLCLPSTSTQTSILDRSFQGGLVAVRPHHESICLTVKWDQERASQLAWVINQPKCVILPWKQEKRASDKAKVLWPVTLGWASQPI